jgi:hypothetical protein
MSFRVNSRRVSTLGFAIACCALSISAAPAATALQAKGPKDAAYDIVAGGSSQKGTKTIFEAYNPSNNLRLSFSDQGLRGTLLKPGASSLAFDLQATRFAYGDAVIPLGASRISATGPRVDFDFGRLTVRYTNSAVGLEQAITVPAPRRGEVPTGPVAPRSTCASRRADPAFDAYFVNLLDPDGKTALRYGAVRATDAKGTVLHGGVTVIADEDGQPVGVRVTVDAAVLQYPVRVQSALRISAPEAAADVAPETDSGTAAGVSPQKSGALSSGAGAGPTVNSELSGNSFTGAPGITETVDELMDRERQTPTEPATDLKAKEEFEVEREFLEENPEAPAVSQWPPAEENFGPNEVLSPQTIGTNFQTVTLTGLTESASIPPDPMGDVGPTQILAATNGRIKVFDKSGVLGALNVSDTTFWASQAPTTGVSDPEIRYDRLSGRWFVLAVDLQATNNKILVAVSSGPTITGVASFTFFNFRPSVSGDGANFCDYPSLGVDANAVYTGCNMFTSAGAFSRTSVYVIRKSTLLGGTLNVTGFGGVASGTVAGPYAPRGVDNDDPTWTQGYFIGVDTLTFSTLQIRRVTNPGSATPTLSANLTLTVPTTTNMVRQWANGIGTANNNRIDASDDRLFMAGIHKNKLTGGTSLWTANGVEVSAAGVALNTGTTNDFKRIGARWYEIGNLTGTPSLTQAGTLFTTTAGASSYNTERGYIFPTVAETGQGHMALGSSYGSLTEFMGSAVSGRLRTDALGTTQAATIATTGIAGYRLCDGSSAGACPRNRWGDYSFTDVDPNDDQTVWTFQEVAVASQALSLGNGSWAVRAIRLVAPPPATPASASSAVCTGLSNTCVTLSGTSSAGSEFFDPGPDTGGPGFANHIGATVTGGVTVNPWPATNIIIPGSPSTTPVTQLTLCLNTTAATPGAKNVTVTNPDTQTASGSGVLTVNATPGPPTASNNGPICAGATLNLFASTVAGATYSWTGPNSFTSNLQNPSIVGATTAATGTYSVKVTVSGCTSSSATTTATVIATGNSCDDNNLCTTSDVCQAGGVCAGTTTVCTALDQCHVAGTCDPTTGVCGNPTAADGTFCGDAEAACVKQDTCVSGACQDNGFKDATTACGDPSNSACDHPDHCTGTGSACDPNYAGAGTLCGDAGGACTNQDYCDGVGACTDNGYKPATTACGDPSSGPCDGADHCTGTDGSCDPNHAPTTTTCGDAGGACTNQDYCDGNGSCFDNGYKPATTACGDPSSGPCDNPDHCTGIDGSCDPNHASTTTTCGDAEGACTNQDYCDGTGLCHDNGFKPATTACGDPSSGPCDSPDHCTGIDGSCDPNHASTTTTARRRRGVHEPGLLRRDRPRHDNGFAGDDGVQ